MRGLWQAIASSAYPQLVERDLIVSHGGACFTPEALSMTTANAVAAFGGGPKGHH
jgi:hypothetical protein